jgi:hypothetical protein
MRPALERTRPVRVLAALVFALVLSSLALAQAFAWRHGFNGQWAGPSDVFGTLAYVIWLGPPFIAGASAIWMLLHHFNRHYAWTAGLTGVTAGLAVPISGSALGAIELSPAILLFFAGAGLVTGLGVWLIAYQSWPQSPKPTAI